MHTSRFTTHFSFLLQLLQITKYSRPLLLGAAFFCFFSSQVFANLKIALVDTGFCVHRALILSPNHKVLSAIDMTGSYTFDCKKLSGVELKNLGRFHGQNVLNEFLSFVPKEIPLTLTPLVVYDHKGNQTKKAWLAAIDWIKKEKIDLVLTASGFISAEKIATDLPALWFVPSGRTERFITEKTVLFPQSLAPRENLFVIGDYYDDTQIIYDQALLYKNQIDYYFPSGRRSFQGTSRAVAEAAAKAIEKCLGLKKDLRPMKVCLTQFEKTLRDPILKKDFKTF